MNKRKSYLVTLLLLLVLGFVSLCLFSVSEGQDALISRLGRLVQKDNVPTVYQPGLHVKLPFVDRVLYFDTRLQTLDIQSSRIVTNEKKDVIVDYFVKWRINNLPLYFTRTAGQIFRTEKLLEQQVNDSLRAEFGRRSIREVVSDERADIMKTLNANANKDAVRLGIIVLDVRIKRIDLPEEVSNAVFERMRAERERVAKEHRAKGEADAEAIRAEADSKATVIVATAKSQSNMERARGDEEASQVYANAYSKDPEFYSFFRSLQAYNSTFNDKSSFILLSPESQFFSYFNNPSKQTSK